MPDYDARQSYRIPPVSTIEALVDALNMQFGMISDRLDQLEGRRGTPEFYADIQLRNNKIKGLSPGTSSGEALTADLPSNSGLAAQSTGLTVAASNGITIDSTGVAVAPYHGISVSSDGVTVVPGTGVSVSESGVAVAQTVYDEISSKADSNQTFYIGTTATAINRASSAQALTGISSVTGSSAASGTLTLESTSSVTKGKIVMGSSAYDEYSNRLGIGTDSPDTELDIYGDCMLRGVLAVGGASPVDNVTIQSQIDETNPPNNTHRIYVVSKPTYTGNETVEENNSGVSLYLRPVIGSGHTNSGEIVANRFDSMRNINGVDADDNGTLSKLYGIRVLYGHYNENTSASPSTTLSYGIHILPYHATGNITGMYDIFLANPVTGGSFINRWGIYQQNTSNNRLNGNVGIGKDPSYELDVDGTINATTIIGDLQGNADTATIAHMYGTGDPPDPTGIPEGTLYLKHS